MDPITCCRNGHSPNLIFCVGNASAFGVDVLVLVSTLLSVSVFVSLSVSYFKGLRNIAYYLNCDVHVLCLLDTL